MLGDAGNLIGKTDIIILSSYVVSSKSLVKIF